MDRLASSSSSSPSPVAVAEAPRWLKLTCQRCLKETKVSAGLAGRSVPCSGCERSLTVPGRRVRAARPAPAPQADAAAVSAEPALASRDAERRERAARTVPALFPAVGTALYLPALVCLGWGATEVVSGRGFGLLGLILLGEGAMLAHLSGLLREGKRSGVVGLWILLAVVASARLLVGAHRHMPAEELLLGLAIQAVLLGGPALAGLFCWRRLSP